ncbi:cysteine desulfurase SufS [Proteus vulgaris]|uniref:Cysteine desulfurase n=2 Tax=Proteus TaxID=583 RepID=A0ABZ3EHM5_9GAMM|nr:cysteine desulfurase SufS [Proteus faecis]MCT8247872.1 cysteine desulfurase SufS [Proteus faecis]MDM3868390.1 cysteine desulfurase SufS [Proteus faecis]QNH64378.1 cysteine desulfurase SufS [Proteus vulgaris]
MTHSIEKARDDFPILLQQVKGKPLIYLDSAASAQKPACVIEHEKQFALTQYAAVHRGIHTLSANATTLVENVRKKASHFLGAHSEEEIIFVKGTTEGINLLANVYSQRFLNDGDNIIITEMEHHANIVPWYMLAKQYGFNVRVLPLLQDGTLDLAQLPRLIDKRTKLLSLTHQSNVLGTVNPIVQIIRDARQYAIEQGGELHILVDGAQSVMHQTINVSQLDCDFFVCSGHKLYGPTGIGLLYGKKEILNELPPWEGGGAMIKHVHINGDITYVDAPWRFEAGTPNIVGMIGLGAALDYLSQLGMNNIAEYENHIMKYAQEQLQKVKSLTLYGNDSRQGVIAFNLGKHHAYDVGAFLDNYGIAIRTGHHCAMPIMDYYQVPAMCRASLGLYTNKSDIDALVNALLRVEMLLG